MTLCIDADGFLIGADNYHIVRFPNYSERPEGASVILLVIHNISLPAGRFGTPYIEQLFTGTLDTQAEPGLADLDGLRVSAHFLIRRDGEIIQFVSTEHQAWHAGVSDFLAKGNCNPYSISIELEGSDCVPFEQAHYQRLACLTEALRKRYPLRAVRGHSDIAPERKTDPGPHYDWRAI